MNRATPPGLLRPLALALAVGLGAPATAVAGPSPFGPQPVTTQPAASPPVDSPRPVVVAPSALPDEVRDSVTLTEVFGLLKQRSPRYKSVQYEVDVAKADVKQARVLPNPIINIALLYLNQGFNQNGVATYYGNVTLPILIAGQRRWRVKAAETSVKSAEASVKATYHDLAHDARSLFVDLQAAQERVRVLDEALVDLARLELLIKERRRSGVETEYDTIRIAIEVSAWKARRAEEEADAQDTAGQLGVLLGIPAWYPRAEGEFKQLGVTGNPDAMWSELERTQPAIEAARREEAASVKNIDLQRRERWPVPSITAGTVAIQNYYSISTSVGLTMPIPIFDWGQGQMARAEARSQQARLQKEAVVASTQAELKRAMRLLEHRRSALQTFESDVFARIPTLKQMSEDAFRDGQAQLIELLDATRARFEVKLTHIDMQEAVIQSEVDLLAVTGRIEETRP